MDQKVKLKAGFSLTELLCVIAILLILAALYLPTLTKAYQRVRTFVEGMSW
jgi:prepilin-type N-terminal cleavage/methylation domain-containing protein